MLAVTGQLTLNNNPVDVAVGIDMLDYHRANAEALHRLSTDDAIPAARRPTETNTSARSYTHQEQVLASTASVASSTLRATG